MSAGKARQAGFTLMEMLVVLTIIGLLAAVAMSNLSIRPAFVDRARLRRGVEAAIALAHQQAQVSGQPVQIDLTRIGLKGINVSAGLAATPRVLVYPDGSTDGGIVQFNGKPALLIDWMTGRVTDAQR